MRINDTHYTTIWLDEEDNLQIIDQTKLPFEFKIVQLETVEECCFAILNMQVRGAGLIGITAAMAVYVAIKNAPEQANVQEFNDYMQKAYHKIRITRPTASNLGYALERMLVTWENKTREEALAPARALALFILEEDIEFCKSIGMHGLAIIEEIAKKKNNNTVNILTHCNAGWLAFGDYGSALSPIFLAHQKGIKVHVWVDETRPRNQGASLTSFELVEEGISHNLIADNTGGHLMQKGLVDMCIVGADRVTKCGDVANKIGTYLKALAAKDNGIPFYVAFPSSTLDFKRYSGSEIPIEEREGAEVETLYGVKCDINGSVLQQNLSYFRICPEKTKGKNYAFDVTPARLITAFISDRGIFQASEEGIKENYPDNIK